MSDDFYRWLWVILITNYSLQNMITNAIKFTSTGYVKLSASYEQHDGIVKVIAVVEDTGMYQSSHAERR